MGENEPFVRAYSTQYAFTFKEKKDGLEKVREQNTQEGQHSIK